jgi:hypothetical protein
MKLESKFYSSLGNGAAALQYAVEMINSVVASRDTTVLSKAITRAVKKGDDKAAQSVRFMVRQVWPGVKSGKDKAGQVSIKIKGIDHDEEAIQTLKSLVSEGASLRGTKLTKTFKSDEEKDSEEFDYVQWAKRMDKAHDLDKMIAALQALRS